MDIFQTEEGGCLTQGCLEVEQREALFIADMGRHLGGGVSKETEETLGPTN